MSAPATFARVSRLVHEAELAERWANFAREARRGYRMRGGMGDYGRASKWERAENVARERAARKRERVLTFTGRD